MRTTATGTISSSTTTRTDPVSHIPTITSSNKLIKNKQSKDDGLKRASVRRTLGRSKLSRSPVKPIISTVSSVTPTNITITTTIANSQISPTHERVHVEEILGPVTRSRMCRFCTTPDDSANETNHKRGKRSLSNSRFHDKKNKLSRKNQITAPTSVTGVAITRRLRKEASLDSALSEVASSQEPLEPSSLSEPMKDATKPKTKKPAARSASQKVLTTN